MERNLAHETLRVRDVSSWLELMRYECLWLKAVVRLGAISCGDEARGCGLAWELSLGNSRGEMIGRTLGFLNFEVKFIEPQEKDHELSVSKKSINMTHHSSQVSADLIWEIVRMLPWKIA
jgi:hypothetical protein